MDAQDSQTLRDLVRRVERLEAALAQHALTTHGQALFGFSMNPAGRSELRLIVAEYQSKGGANV